MARVLIDSQNCLAISARTQPKAKVGTVVEVLRRGQAFEVEFADRQGRTYESLGLTPDQFIVLRYEPSDPRLAAELALA